LTFLTFLHISQVLDQAQVLLVVKEQFDFVQVVVLIFLNKYIINTECEAKSEIEVLKKNEGFSIIFKNYTKKPKIYPFSIFSHSS